MAAAEPITESPITDEELIDQIQHGNRAAFDTLYERYFPRVSGYVRRRVSNRADSDEIIQQPKNGQVSI